MFRINCVQIARDRTTNNLLKKQWSPYIKFYSIVRKINFVSLNVDWRYLQENLFSTPHNFGQGKLNNV